MRVVIVMDSFKGSLGSLEAGRAVERGVLEAYPEARTLVLPFADGGEGTAAENLREQARQVFGLLRAFGIDGARDSQF